MIEFSYIQKMHAIEILKIFQMLDCNFVQTPVDRGMKLDTEGNGNVVDATLYKNCWLIEIFVQ